MTVSIMGAYNLQRRHMFRSPIYYAELRVRGDLIGRTKGVKGTPNPRWSESFKISADRGDMLSITIKDELFKEDHYMNTWIDSASIHADELAADIIHEDYDSFLYREMDTKFESMLDLALDKLIYLVSY